MPPPRPCPLYEELLFDRLGIPKRVYEEADHLKAIREKVTCAADAMRGGLTEFVGLNVCIHVASSAVLLGSSTQARLQVTLQELRQEFPEIDPTTVVTAASLYYIIKGLESRNDLTASEKTNVEHVRKRLSELGWLIGAERMRKLGMSD